MHGPIELEKAEALILDSAPMQRLRHVRQLGLAHLVYPGAHHSRFEHSLGCLHLAEKMARMLGLKEEDRVRLRLAALLHDVGHLAFSHDSESVMAPYFGDHEKRGAKIVCKSQIADLISEHASPSGIARWMQGASYGQLIASDVGADRLDYLLRDAHYTGVAYGIIDYHRIISTLSWNFGKPALKSSGLEAAESMIIARFEMFHAVYYHHTVRIVRSMLQKALVEWLESKEASEEKLEQYGDFELMLQLRNIQKSRQWVDALLSRRLYKRALMVDWKKLDEKLKKSAKDGSLAQELSSKCGCEVLVSPPEDFKSKATVLIMLENKPMPLDKASPLVGSLQDAAEARAQLLIAAPQRKIGAVSQAAKKELGI